MKKISLLILTVTGLLISCNIFEPENIPNDANYPVTFPALPQATLDSLGNILADLNPEQYCGTLDSLGFTGKESCHRHGDKTLAGQNEALKIAREALFRNRQFTNVFDTTQLSVLNTMGLFDSTEWSIEYAEQQYLGKTILDTRLTVIANSEGVLAIYNHWYPEFYIPASMVYDSTDVKNILRGRILTFAGFGGEPHQFQITLESMSGHKTVQTIVPYQTAHGVEMRLAWRVPVLMSGGFPDWFIYVDVITGKTIRTRQLFRT